MKINFLNLVGKNIQKNLILPHRSLIYVGYKCSQKCGFCYYKLHYTEPMFDRNYVIRQIDLELEYGITDFEITGGEPSECKDLTFYCKYIKDKLPNAKIAIITNGGLYAIDDVWPYIDEVLVSYHISKLDNNIDKNIFPYGSTYNKVKKTIDKAKQLNKLIRTNTVIGTFNVDSIKMIVDDLIEFNPNIINFLPLNLFDNAIDMAKFIDYTKLKPILKRSIDYIKEKLPNVLLFIRYIPYCQMEGYEQYIVASWLHMFDWFDWNPELCGYYIIEYLNKYKTNADVLKYLGPFGTRSLEKSYDCISAHYEKTDKCVNCKYYVICDGVEKTSAHALYKDIVPSKGKLIKNPMQFIGTTIQDFYKKIYG